MSEHSRDVKIATCDSCHSIFTKDDLEAFGVRVRLGRVTIGDYCCRCWREAGWDV